VRNKFVALSLVLLAFFVFGLGLWTIAFAPQGALPRVAAPPPPSIGTAPVKAQSAPPATAATLPTPTLKDIPKAVVVERTQAPATSAARANSRVASAVAPSATLLIEVDHRFAEAKLSVWVDDRLTYTHMLEGTDKKRLVVFRHVQGHEVHAIQLSAGKHRLRVEVAPGGGVSDQSASVAGEFNGGRENVLQVNFDKSGEMNLTLQN
jgi:hypothetical protein